MHKPSAIQSAIYWLRERRMTLGLLIAVVPLIALWVLVFRSHRQPPAEVVGTVISLGLSNTGKTGGEPAAVVSVDGRRVSVVLPYGHLCTAGGPIRLLRSTGPFGTRYSDETVPCPAGGAKDERRAPALRVKGA